MPSSQLKRLKASLREQGIVGPQQSKKQKKKTAQDAQAKKDKRLKRSAALENIREQFNPFQFKMNARGPKFQVTSNKPQDDSAARGIKGRPGVALSRSEERRRQTLLMEMQRRNKVGGILDRRFGEDDPDMTPEEKALQRFAIEKQRSHKKNSLFDLEDDDGDAGFMHLGGKLALDEADAIRDDFDEMDLLSDEDGSANGQRSTLKRKRVEGFPGEEEDDEDQDGPPRRKSNQEVYKEVIAKSKFYKYERQAAKEEDEDIRMEIDKELSNLRPLLFARKEEAQAADPIDQDVPVKSIAGIDKDEFEKEYDSRLRRMIQDKRAQPSERTKTEEELAEEQSARLKELEEKRVKRMLGQEDSDDDEDKAVELDEDGEPIETEADRATRDLGAGIKATATELGFDDEDDFIIEDDLVASGSDIELEDDLDLSDQDYMAGSADEDDDGFTTGLLTEEETKNPAFLGMGDEDMKGPDDDSDIPFTFPCPQTHAEFLEISDNIRLDKLVTAVQRIRALYHPSLDSRNKERLQNFSVVLVQHVAHLGDKADSGTFPALEGIIRHIHSLAKAYPRAVAETFRSHLIEMESQRPLSLGTRDLVILKAIQTIFPTSDHFHVVITPAMLAMGRYLGQKTANDLSEYATGIYLSILFLEYQQLSKRYVPELVNFVMNTTLALAPAELRGGLGNCNIHLPSKSFRIRDATDCTVRKLDFNDCRPDGDDQEKAENSSKVAILSTAIAVMTAAMELWSGKAAFLETFQPFLAVLKHLAIKPCRSHLPSGLNQEVERVSGITKRMLKVAHLSRRPLELHHHRPIAIKTYVPKFEESGFNPDKHYDPNRERSEMAKLKAEHKKERKGIMRELRKDTQFMAREKLKIKKSKDEAYEKKYKRLVAEIQGEEGREANAYEREKQMRKKARHR